MTNRAFNRTLFEQYQEQGEVCLYCNENFPFEQITRDHFKPKSESNTFVNNKVFACFPCNNEKGNFTIKQLYNKDLREIRRILNTVIQNNWKMTQVQLDRFRYLSKRFKTIGKIIQNGGKPKKLFT